MAETQPTRASNFELRDYFRIVWTRKWSAFIVLLLVVGGVMFLSFRQTPIYQSQVKLIIVEAPPNAGSGVVGSLKADVEVEAQLAASPIVAQKVKEALSWARNDDKITADKLLRFITVVPLKNTGSILLFQAQHPNPERAADLAQQFGISYLEFRIQRTIDPFKTALATAKNNLDTDSAELDSLPPFKPTEPRAITDRRSTLTQAVSIDNQQILSNTQAIADITSSAKQAIYQPAKVSHHPVRPDHLRDGIFAVIIGLALGIGTAFLRDYADDSLRGPDDLERQAGAPLLGVIPHVSSKVSGNKSKRQEQYLVSVADSKAPATESYRTLRTNLLFFSVGGPIRRLLIASPVKGEGKSTTAANLATVMALAGQRVLLVGADLRRPSIHKFFGLSNRIGLSSVLSGQSTLMEAIQDPGVKGLRVMAGGPVPPNPAELLGSASMKQFLEQAADAADWVILDGPPVLGLADASVLATLSDAVLLVVNEATNRRVLAHARDQLAKVRSRVVGAVLNNFGPATSYYYYADYYAYTSSYYYEQESEEKGRRRSRKERKAKKAAQSGKKRGGKSGTNGNGFETGVDLETDTVEVAGVQPAPAAPPAPEPPASPKADADSERSTTSFFK